MKLRDLICRTVEERYEAEMALGFLRYEELRKLNAKQFAALHASNIKGEGRFDDLVDAMIITRASGKGCDCK